MPSNKSYVRVDEHGVMRVGQTRVMLDGVIAAFQQGHSAETIAQQYPALTLEEVYGAIAYCLANTEEIDKYMCRQDGVWDAGRRQANQTPSPVVMRLRTQTTSSETDAK